jgi:hypothetical protein
MVRILKTCVIALAIESIAFGIAAAELPKHNAPFGLQFGMSAVDVKLPKSPAPELPNKRQELPSNQNYFGYDFPTNERIFEEKQYKEQYEARASLLKDCTKSFDSPYLSNHGDASWFEWTYSRGISTELSDLNPRSILEPSQFDMYFKFKKQVDEHEFPQPDIFRSVSIHTVRAAGTDRDVCLIFTEDGLTYVFAPLIALKDVIDEIYGRLSTNADYELFLSRRNYIPLESLSGYRFITERKVWLDKSRKIMVSSKRIESHNGLEGLWKTAFLENDFKDDLLPFISYTDLVRRGKTYERYKERTLHSLTAAISEVIEADEARKKLKDEIERTKREIENSDRKSLIDSFK